jgi:TonB family protein
MKFAFTLFVLFLHSAVSAQHINVSVIDGWKSKPIANCQVTLESIKGKALAVTETDSQGSVIFSDLSIGEYTVVIADIGEDFYGSEFQVKLRDDRRIECILKTKQAYELRQLAIEDSIYGEVEPVKMNSIQRTEDGKRDSVILDPPSVSVDVAALFPGGTGELNRFIQMNVEYPEISRNLGLQGRLYVTFMVETDGVINHVEILKSLAIELDEEAMRLVRAMPNWTPALVDGEKVRSRCTLPITYTLQ